MPFALPTLHLGISASVGNLSVAKGHFIDKSTGRFLRYGAMYAEQKEHPKYRAETTGAVTGSFLEIAKAVAVCSGLSRAERGSELYRTLRNRPYPDLSRDTLGSWHWWSEGLFHGGSYGSERAEAQIVDKAGTAIFWFTNCAYEDSTTRTRDQPDIKPYVMRVNNLTKSEL